MSTQSFKITILDGSPTNDTISQNVNAAMINNATDSYASEIPFLS